MTTNFCLYHLTLQPPTAVTSAVVGSFSAADRHEFVVARGNFLEVLRRDAATSLLRTVHREACFGSIRALSSVRITGQSRDLLVVTSDSGRLSVLKFGANGFEKLYCDTYGKTGIRRAVPGEYMATDPAGRAVMIAAIEKDKFVFAINRDSDDQLFVSSPLEAHKYASITFALVGLDVGYDNPMFAAIETVYDDEEEGKKLIVFYEVDLGLNHVVRKWSKPVSDSANFLIAVPNAGVVVCSSEGLEYVKPNEPTLKIAIPKRSWDDPARDAIVIASTFFKKDDIFFAILQTERGDLFKLSLDSSAGKVGGLVLKYFDSVAAANAMCLSKDGFLFVGSEFGNHELYQVVAVGDLDGDKSIEIKSNSDKLPTSPAIFEPRNEVLNLSIFDIRPSLSPIVAMRVADLARDSGVNQVYALCGRAEKSTLRTLRQGLGVMEAGNIRFASNKNEINRGVWTVRHAITKEERYILIAQKDSTKIFSVRTEPGQTESDASRDVIAEDTTTNNIFVRDQPTISAGAWGKGSEMIQVTTSGWRRINYETKAVVSHYTAPSPRRVDVACVTSSQICLAFPGGEVLYFESDQSGQPVERARLALGTDIACLDQNASLLALGCWDGVVRILSLDSSSLLVTLSSQKVPSKPHSLCLVRDDKRGQVRLEVGLQNGLLVRSLLDTGSSGAIVDTRSHVLGSKPVRVQRVLLNVAEDAPAEQVTMCCSTRVWLARAGTSPAPLSFRPFEFAAAFKASVFNGMEGMVVLGPGSALSIASLDGYGLDPARKWTDETHKLDRTPRRMVVHPSRNDIIVLIEGDRDSFVSSSTTSIAKSTGGNDSKVKSADDMDVDEEEDDGATTTNGTNVHDGERDANSERGRIVGHARQKDPDAAWAGCVRVINPFSGQTLQRLHLGANEIPVSIEKARFGADDYLFVGAVQGMRFHPRTAGACSVRAYKFLPTGGKLELIHITKTEEIPLALTQFEDRLLCGSGTSLTLYDMGHKQLLRKCELKNLPSLVAFVKSVSNERLIVGDSSESVYFVHYSKEDNAFSVFADDVTSRLCVAGEALDSNTCATSDKFGSVSFLRLPAGATGNDPRSRAAQSRSALWDQSSSGGAPHKVELIANFYVGDVITTMQKCTLAPGRTETLLYGTILGALGSFSPFTSRDDLDFFSLLEIQLRKVYKSVLGRDHLQYRSYYTPVKSVIDGDLCEVFVSLPSDMKEKIAKELDRSVEDVSRRIEEMRGNVMW